MTMRTSLSTALEALYEREAHFLLCGENKRPVTYARHEAELPVTKVERILTSAARASQGRCHTPQLPMPPTGLMAAFTTLGVAYRSHLRGQRQRPKAV